MSLEHTVRINVDGRCEVAMSKQNKANKSNYVQAGRLTPDDLAREQKKQGLVKEPGARMPASRPHPKRGEPRR
jgi:hypothetical protein